MTETENTENAEFTLQPLIAQCKKVKHIQTEAYA